MQSPAKGHVFVDVDHARQSFLNSYNGGLMNGFDTIGTLPPQSTEDFREVSAAHLANLHRVALRALRSRRRRVIHMLTAIVVLAVIIASVEPLCI